MDRQICTDLTALRVPAFEKEVLIRAEPHSMPPRTLIRETAGEKAKELLYWNTAGLVPLARIRAPLADMFFILESYIRSIGRYCDMLLNVENAVSDPARVFVSPDGTIRLIYGSDEKKDLHEKICAVAELFAAQESVPGAASSFAALASQIAERRPTLQSCLRMCETQNREWNRISGKR
jgi:hypothetical protein